MANVVKDHYQVLIAGGGTAGITVSAQLRRKLKYDVAIVEPSQKHYYQPLWTLVGAGVFDKEISERFESAFVPQGADWVQEPVVEFRPEENAIVTGGGLTIGYDYLVVALGIQIDWSKIPGLAEGIGRDGICSNYSYQHVDYTW